MKLIFIYGPPAAGKLTVATELSKLLGYKLLDNHSVINTVTRIFPFNDIEHGSLRRKLSRQIRLELFEAAAQNNINVITTLGASGQEYFDFFEDTQSVIEANNGTVCFVQLLPSVDALYERVEQQSRKNFQKLDSKTALSDRINNQSEMFVKYPNVHHFTLDNTKLSPIEAALAIQKYYNL